MTLGRSWRRAARRRLGRNIIRLRASPMVVSPRPAVILAPHPDDEVLAAGGLIAAKRDAGAAVTVVYLTAGEASHADCCDIAPTDVAAARRSLAEQATARLGLASTNLKWLNLPDSRIPGPGEDGFDTAATQLAEWVAGPAEIYAPHPLDARPDHAATTAMARQLADVKTCDLRGYLTWGWFKNSLWKLCRLAGDGPQRLDIRPQRSRKLAALNIYFSATADGCGRPYVGVLPEGFAKWFTGTNEFFWPLD